MMQRGFMRAVCVGFAIFASAADVTAAACEVRAEEVRVRHGVGNFLGKVAAGRPVTVAYFGGSITAMDGWRRLTTEWLRKTYPNVSFTEVQASVGGTDSDLGAFRCGHDVLAHAPDLVFVEFATNDRTRRPDSVARSMEGIVRQIWRKDPSTDIVFAYTIVADMLPDYARGVCPPATATMERLADRYGIPSVDFGPRVAAEVRAGRLVMNQFAKDGVHPTLHGHGYYLASVTNCLARMRGLGPVDHSPQLAGEPHITGNLENAKMVEPPEGSLVGNWRKIPPKEGLMQSFSDRTGQIYHSDTPGAMLRFRFRGTRCAIYDFVGPDGGQVWVAVDGKRRVKPTPRFDSYCTYHRLAMFDVFEGNDGEHEVTITIDREQPNRRSVAFRLKDPEKELASRKYDGTNFWPVKIMIVGDILDAGTDRASRAPAVGLGAFTCVRGVPQFIHPAAYTTGRGVKVVLKAP